jgi:DMSO/TMAO reductase YedYZ molybdopterin-dependent catalytic subunit
MTRLTRRQALRLAVMSISSAAVAGCTINADAPATPAPTPVAAPTAAAPGPTAAPPARYIYGGGPSVSITPIADFYNVAISQRHDWLDAQSYRLAVSGEVERALTLSLSDIRALPAVEEMRTLECIGNPAGGELIGNAVWKGARLADVLQRAGLRSAAIEIRLRGADAYATSVPVALATDRDCLLAYEMNGAPLPDKHGAPLRALLPGRYGQKQAKWLVAIEAIGEPFLGHWERQGWSNDAIVKVNAQMRTPESSEIVSSAVYPISGTAFANQSGVAGIEVSADGGATWQTARLVRGPSPLAWSEWRFDWITPASGDARLIVRATDGDGARQPLRDDSGMSPDSVLEGTWTAHQRSATVRK